MKFPPILKSQEENIWKKEEKNLKRSFYKKIMETWSLVLNQE